MGIDFFAAFLMLLLTISGGAPGTRHSDLLDMIPTESYWRVKGVTVTRAQLESDVGAARAPAADLPKLVKDLESLSRRDNAMRQLAEIGAPALDLLRAATRSEDPEAAAMARELITTISQRGKERDIRRLMAIRTLGERKEKDALPLLKSLADSKELFVADYAARAVAQIDGTPVKPTEAANLADDLKLLPATTGIIGQTTGLGLPGFTLDALFQMAANAANLGGNPAPARIERGVDELTRNLLAIAEQVGNIRADGATMAVSADIGGKNEWFIVSVSGLYDRQAVAEYAARINRNTPVTQEGDMIRLSLSREAAVLMPSDRRLIFAAANPANTQVATILDPMIECLATGKAGTLADNKPLDDLLKTVDKTGIAWVAGIPSAKMRSEMPVFAPFDTIAITAKADKEVLKVTGTARGGGDVQPAVAQFNSVRNSALAEIRRLVNTSKEFQPLLDGIESAKISAEDKGASATATVSPDIVKSIIAAIAMEFRLIRTPPPQPRPVVPQGLP